MFGNCNHCCFCCGHPCTMLRVSLFISCKNKIQCVCKKQIIIIIIPYDAKKKNVPPAQAELSTICDFRDANLYLWGFQATGRGLERQSPHGYDEQPLVSRFRAEIERGLRVNCVTPGRERAEGKVCRSRLGAQARGNKHASKNLRALANLSQGHIQGSLNPQISLALNPTDSPATGQRSSCLSGAAGRVFERFSGPQISPFLHGLKYPPLELGPLELEPTIRTRQQSQNIISQGLSLCTPKSSCRPTIYSVLFWGPWRQ